MQSLSLEFIRTFCRTINLIAQNWMSDTGHMNTDLMCPTGFKLALNVGKITKSFQYTVMSDCMSPIWCFCTHLFTICRVPTNRSVYSACILLQIAMYDSVILSFFRFLTRNHLIFSLKIFLWIFSMKMMTFSSLTNQKEWLYILHRDITAIRWSMRFYITVEKTCRESMV